MDWPRAKTILIVCFLVLNLFMSYELYIQPVFLGSSDNLSPGRFDSIMNVLSQNGLEIQIPVPRLSPPKAFLSVSVNPFSQDEIQELREMLLGEDAVLISEVEFPTEFSAVTYMLGSEELVVTSLGYLSYYNRGIFTESGRLTPEEAQEKADQFVEQKLGGREDFVYDSIMHIDPMGYRVQYVQIHEDISIYPAQLMILVNPRGVAAVWLCRLEVKDSEATTITIRSVAERMLSLFSRRPRVDAQGNYPRPIRSAAESLLSLVSHRFAAGETAQLSVLEMELGYHTRIYDTLDPWLAAPVWRIRTDQGDFYINAHSGVIED